jgi:16S rRNA processing protein RimM
LARVSPDRLILLGRVIRSHGTKGLLRIWSYARSEASFLEAQTVYLESASGEIYEYRVTSVRPQKNVLLMKLEGLDTAESAGIYEGSGIFVRKESLTREGDEYFWYECLGLEVYLDTGGYLGILSQIIPTGGHDIYVVKEGPKEILLPATDEVVKVIDLEKGKMIVSALEGLLDLNEV